jgi:hypothetical protein
MTLRRDRHEGGADAPGTAPLDAGEITPPPQRRVRPHYTLRR